LEAVFNNGLARIRLHKQVAFPEYVYYVFKSRDFINYIDGISGGTSVQLNMKVGDLANFKFQLPPLAEQKGIAHILATLDDKIELNRRMNATLEVLAQNLFKSWFVDATQSALPKGWRYETIAELCEINSWTLSKSEELDRIEYVEISEVMRGNITKIQTYERGEEPSRARRRFAKHMRDALPKASFIGFTGTPIERGDKNTQAVFGDYIDVYDILQSREDKATVAIYYEARLAKIDLKPEERPKIDPNFEGVTEDAEESTKQSLRRKWAQLEAMVGTDKRISLVAEDLVKHWEARYAAMEGKAMVVCMSRRICVELYKAIQKLRPDWHHADDDKGTMKIVMSGSAIDKLEWQQHIRNKSRREELAKAFKNPKKPFKIVIVRDMWLTGFDAPCLHTMYLDKPMRGHGLMQAIARVNRVFKDKPGGLVVDYLGLAEELKQALADYTNSKGKGEITLDQEAAVAVMLEKYEQVCGILHGFNYQSAAEAVAAKRMPLIAQAVEHVLRQKDGKSRYLLAVMELSKAFALAVPNEQALEIRDEVGFFQEVRAVLAKPIAGGDGKKSPEELDTAVRQIVSRAISSDRVIDIFDAAGLKKPDISILSDEFLAEVQHLPQRNLAVELLQKLLNNELKIRSRKYLVQSRSFAEMLEATIRKYQNRSIEAAQVIAELIDLAKQMREGQKRGQKLGLTDDEVAFYDALETNDTSVKVLGEPTLKTIARELVSHVRKSVTIDWTLRESARAQIRVLVRRILRKYGYPPDKQEKATQTVLEQAELLCAGWAE
jgi:type I restriction enzyme R subunit